jgi:ElaB/YqjD/DUF883 family membrane-anchored ribosome-binding protein
MDEEARTGRAPVSAGSTRAGSTAPGDEDTRTPEQIREDIERTRGDLGDTVEALAAKTDVKGQAKQRAEEIKSNLQTKREELTGKARQATPAGAREGGQQVVAKVKENPAPVALGGAVLAGFLLGRLIGRR